MKQARHIIILDCTVEEIMANTSCEQDLEARRHSTLHL